MTRLALLLIEEPLSPVDLPKSDEPSTPMRVRRGICRRVNFRPASFEEEINNGGALMQRV